MAAKSNSLRYVALAAALLLSLAGAAYIRYELVFLVPYILAVLIVYRWGRPEDTYIVAAFSTVLIIAGHWLDGPAQSTLVNVGEHLVQIATLWLVALLLAQRLKLEQRLARQQADLEAQVRARTAALEAEIAERRTAEAALQASEERYRTLFRVSPGGILVTGQADGRYIDVNDTFAELVGYTREELIGRTSVELGILPPADRDLMLSLLRSGGTVRGTDAQIIAKTGEAIDVVYFIEPVAIDGAPCLLSSVFDNRARKQMEQQLRGLNEELENRVARRTAALAAAMADLQRASRLKDEFMGVMSHELRTPLTGIMASAELLESEVVGPLNARQLRHVHSVMQSGERLLTMVESILSYTNIAGGSVELHPERCELAPLLATAAAHCDRSRKKRRQSLSIVVDPQDLAVTTDCTGLTAVLDRLLDNAVKFTPEGGALGLDARCVPTGVQSEARAVPLPGGVQIVVWDTGIGIGPDHLAKVTEPFTQADSRLARAYEGAGLGLAYVTQMLDLLGGRLDVDSNPGQGSRFIVTLP